MYNKGKLAAMAAVVGLMAASAGLGNVPAVAAGLGNCSPGHHAAACVGLQHSHNHPNLVWLPNLAVGTFGPGATGTIKITGPARLDVPSYTISSLNQTNGAMTERFLAGPGLVKSWAIPGGGSGASVYVVPNHPNQAGTATVTVSVPGGGPANYENGIYRVSWPALAGSGKVTAKTIPFLISHIGNATIQLSANKAVFARSQRGPWVRAMAVPAGGSYWFRTPAQAGGLNVEVASGGNGSFEGLPTGSTVALAMSLPTAPVRLTMSAAAHGHVGQWVPILVHARQNGHAASGRVALALTRAPHGTQLRTSHVVLKNGVAHDAIESTAAGVVVVAAQMGSAKAADHIALRQAPARTEHTSAHPWWIFMLLVLLAVAAWLLRRRFHRHRAPVEPDSDSE